MFALPKFIHEILDTLHTAGYEAYVVGGAVRDMLLGNTPSDFDITTSCPPFITATLFDKTINTGIKHGTVTVVSGGKCVEVTTYRRDLSYTDHRKPDEVDFISNLFEDLKRRDFTINAMALSSSGELIDSFNGQNDLSKKTVRAVGNPNKRFSEDALRILRAFRFSARLNFEIEEDTFNAAINTASLLKSISRERIFAELKQIILSDHPEKAEPLINCGGLAHLGITKAHDLNKLSVLPKNIKIRFFAFCEQCECSPTDVCRNLKTDNELLNYCLDMQKLLKENLSFDDIGIKKALNLAAEQVLKDCTLLPSFNNNESREEILNNIDKIIKSGEPYKLQHLKISGEDIISLSVSGKEVGKVLNYLLNKVIEKPQDNEKSRLTEMAKDFINRNAQ
ncbi:MAG: CCA tRNA nucleotidyltransferase [Ruminococcaceae bacterium]|nr:CCA tRNA nucleotidyltransferase [Oscillospiraceae bacterium]